MLYDAIIFDCDGTLVDSEYLVNEVIAEYATKFGVPLTAAEACARFKGTRMSECVAHIESVRGIALPASFVPEVRQRMAEALSSRLQPIEGALELVQSLSIPFCVASNGPREKTELSLSITGLLPYFGDRIFSAYEVGAWKPDPALFIHAAKTLGVPPARCAVVEDSLPGIQAGIAAGMSVFALVDESLAPQIPTNVRGIKRLQELPELLLRPLVPDDR